MPHPPVGTWISSRFFTFPRMQRPVMARKKTRKTTRKPPVRRAPKGKTSPEPATEPAGEQPGELIDTDRAIEILKTTRPTFYRWLRSGRLKGMKVGRQ